MADEPKPEETLEQKSEPLGPDLDVHDPLTPVAPFVDPDAPSVEEVKSLKEIAKELLEKAGEDWNVRQSRDTGRVVAHLTFDGPNEFGRNMASCDDVQDVYDVFGGTMRVRKQELLREFGELVLGLIAGKGPMLVDFKVERQREGFPAGCYVWRCDLQTFPGTDEARTKELIDSRVAVAKARHEVEVERQDRRREQTSWQLREIDLLNEKIVLSSRLIDLLEQPERSTVEEF